MTDKTKRKNKIYSSRALIALAVLCFANPTVWLVDLIPDFIGCFIIAGALLHPSDRAPYFAEARTAFLKLGVVSLAKLPGFLVLIKVRSANVADYDISALLTFSFAIIEAYLFTVAINNLFLAFYYLGERGECAALITPFKLSGDPHSLSKMKPETLKLYTLVFTYFKLASGSLPEMLQLTNTNDYGSYIEHFDPRLLYPIVLLFGIVLTIVMGVFFVKLFCRYIDAVRAEKNFYSSCDALISDAQRDELNLKIKKREIRHSLLLLVFACVFLFSLRFDNLQQVNLIPAFGFGILALLSVSGIEKYGGRAVAVTVFSALYCFASAYYSYVEMEFLDKYSFDLLATSQKAILEYPEIMIWATLAEAAFLGLIICLGVFLCGFVKRNFFSVTGVDSGLSGERYRSHRISVAIWCVIGAISAVARLCEVIFRYIPNTTVVESGYQTVGIVISGLVPWFGTLVFVINLAFTFFTVHLTGKIKDDADIFLK